MMEKFWWESEKNPHEGIFAAVSNIIQNQNGQLLDYVRCLRFYNSNTANGTAIDVFSPSGRKLSLNIVRSIADTLTSKIAKNRVKISFLTDNGDRTMIKRAEKLQRFVQGQFFAKGVYSLNKKTVKHSSVFGKGLVKVFNDGDDLCVDQTNRNEILVDEMEAYYGKPRCLYQRKLVSLQVLKAKFPKSVDVIDQAKPVYYNIDLPVDPRNLDLTYVVEAYRLPSRKGASDGRKVICLSNGTIIDEKWERDYFPFAGLNYTDPLIGYWPTGICDIVGGIQIELNKVLKRIQQSIHIAAVPHVFYEYSSDFVKGHFDNEVGSMIGYRGAMPQVVTPNVVNADTFNHLDRLYQYGYDLTGVNQLSSQGKKPDGIDSGKALREYADIGSERFFELQDNYNNFHMEIGKMMIDEAKELAKKKKDFAVMAKTNDFAEKIRWSEVNMDDTDYVMHVFPTNLLPSTPEGKLQTSIEMTKAGFFEKDEALSLLDYPDVKSIITIKRAKIDDILDTIEQMIDKGEYLPPEPFQSLQLGIDYCQAYYLKYRRQGVDQQNLELLTRWISDAVQIQNKQKQELINQQMQMAQIQQGQAPGAINPQPLLPNGGLGESTELGDLATNQSINQ